jgi:hypothetical protein
MKKAEIMQTLQEMLMGGIDPSQIDPNNPPPTPEELTKYQNYSPKMMRESVADKLLQPLIELLAGYEQGGYAPDAIHLTRSGADKGGANDNAWPKLEVAETIREWNEHFAYPRLISATPKMFFSYLEKISARKSPKPREICRTGGRMELSPRHNGLQ